MQRTRRFVLLLIVITAGWALLVGALHGIDLRRSGFRLASEDPTRPAVIAIALLLAFAAVFPQNARAGARRLLAAARGRGTIDVIDDAAPAIAVLLSVLVLFLSLKFGAFVAGGADSYGYISQADLWLAGDLTIEQPLAFQVPWEDPDWTLTPLGYRPTDVRGTIVPIYAPGLPLMMAAAKLTIGGFGPYLLTPLLGAATVWLTYLLGARVWSPLVGLGAAAWLSSSPSFLFMLMGPMSDVPVTAFFTAAALALTQRWRFRAAWTGLLVGLAVLVRPNLVPAVAVFAALLATTEVSRRERLRATVLFGLAVLPFVLLVAATNAHLYGAPWRSGYGSFSHLYAWRFLVPNLRQYSRWLVDTQTPLIALCIFPFAFWRRLPREGQRRLAMMAALALIIWLSYVFYLVFDAWWYLRFLLPALPLTLVLAVVGGRLMLSPLTRGLRLSLAAVALVAVVFAQARYARANSVLEVCRIESVYVSVGEWVRARLPPNAILLSAQHSGSLRHYGRRMTMRYDTLSHSWWPRAVPILAALGLRPYVVLTEHEERAFREKFGLSNAYDAPGTVVAELTTIVPVKIYDPLREQTATDTIPNLAPGLCTR